MAQRMAGNNSLLRAAYLKALSENVPSGVAEDTGRLWTPLQERGSVALGANDLRALLMDAASPRQSAGMSPAERLGVIERYLQDQADSGAPMLFPVQDRKGVYGASVIDGDRLVVHGLESQASGGGELSFVPGAQPGFTHVIEAVPSGDEVGSVHATVLSQPTARKIYGAARGAGYGPVDGVLEDWSMSGGVSADTGPVVQRLFQGLQQAQPAVTSQQGSTPFQIVPSRGQGYDVLGMRVGGRTMGTARLPGEPGWLGNPYVANDAGGQYSRQEATDLFGRLVEQKAQDPAWRDAFLGLQGKKIGYYKPQEQVIHLHALQDWIRRNAGAG